MNAFARTGAGGNAGGRDRIAELVAEHYRLWCGNRRYLGLDWAHYAPDCPPLLFIGGGRLESDAQPLVVVSIEPLRADHFPAQVAFAGASAENHLRWNLDYFDDDIFPALAGPQAQTYWRNMAGFVAGWAGRDVDPRVPWPLLLRHFIELPYIPMHAKRYVPRASSDAEPALRALFVKRAQSIVAAWPHATFMVLSSSIRERIEDAGLLGSLEPVPLPVTHPPAESWGKHFSVEVRRGRLEVDGRPLVFARRGPFSRFTNPTKAGRGELGRRLRAIREGGGSPRKAE